MNEENEDFSVENWKDSEISDLVQELCYTENGNMPNDDYFNRME